MSLAVNYIQMKLVQQCHIDNMIVHCGVPLLVQQLATAIDDELLKWMKTHHKKRKKKKIKMSWGIANQCSILQTKDIVTHTGTLKTLVCKFFQFVNQYTNKPNSVHIFPQGIYICALYATINLDD